MIAVKALGSLRVFAPVDFDPDIHYITPEEILGVVGVASMTRAMLLEIGEIELAALESTRIAGFVDRFGFGVPIIVDDNGKVIHFCAPTYIHQTPA